MAEAVSVRPGETNRQGIVRARAARAMIEDLRPGDLIEAALAGHAVMFHEVMIDAVRGLLRGEPVEMRRGTRGSIVSLDKSFQGNLGRLRQYQSRSPEAAGIAARPSPEPPAPEAPAAKAAVPETLSPETPAPKTPSPETPAQTVEKTSEPPPPDQVYPIQPAAEPSPFATPSRPDPAPPAVEIDAEYAFPPDLPPEIVALCRANPEAMAALRTRDVERFAAAMGVDMPTEADLARRAMDTTHDIGARP
jgi:hypothetical protein